MGIESIAYQQNMQTMTQQASVNQNSVVSDNMRANSDLNSQKRTEGAAKTQEITEEMVSEEEVKKAVEEMNSTMEKYDTNLKFGFDDPTKTLFVSLINAQTNETISQFPGKKALEMRAYFREANEKFLSKEEFFADLKGKLFNVSN